MRIRALVVVLIAFGSSLVAGTQPGDCRSLEIDHEERVELCESTGWFTAADAPVGNLGGIAAEADQDDPGMAGWAAEPPEASVTDGAGSAYVTDVNGVYAPRGVLSARFEGTVTGNIETVALDLYMVASTEYDEYLPGSGLAAGSCAEPVGPCGGTYPLHDVTIEIDGRRMSTGHVDAYLYPPSTSGNVLAMRIRVAVSGLFDGIDDPDAVHDVAVEVLPHDGDVTLLYDAAEWPSKVLFNPADTTSYHVVEVGGGHDHEH